CTGRAEDHERHDRCARAEHADTDPRERRRDFAEADLERRRRARDRDDTLDGAVDGDLGVFGERPPPPAARTEPAGPAARPAAGAAVRTAARTKASAEPFALELWILCAEQDAARVAADIRRNHRRPVREDFLVAAHHDDERLVPARVLLMEISVEIERVR